MRGDDLPPDRFELFRKMLSVKIKLDIAGAIRAHPHLEGAKAAEAYDALANDATIDQLLQDMAREEIAHAASRGEVPGAAHLKLAGYRMNNIEQS
jgi:hypothetical protein